MKPVRSNHLPVLRVVALVAIATAGAGMSAGSQFPQRGQRGRDTTLEDAMQRPDDEPQLFAATVSRVRVDVIVTDGDGNFVADLQATDFNVYEDGELQEIVDLQLVDLAAGEVHPLLTDATTGEVTADNEDNENNVAAPAATVPGDDPAAAVATTPSAASQLGAIIFLVDGPSLNQAARSRFGDAWTDLLEQTDALNVPRAAYMVNNVGGLVELAPLGYDAEAMLAAAATVRSAPFTGANVNERMFEIIDDLTTLDPEIARQVAVAKARSFEGQERNRALATYEMLTSFADALWARPGRTAVIWVSTGVKLMQGGPYTALFAQENSATTQGLAGARFDVISPDPRIAQAQDALHLAANGSNVSFYTVDPSLLADTRHVGADARMSSAAGAQLLSSPVVQQSIDGLRDSMRTAAAATGGKAFIHATDIEMVLEEIERDTGRFYLLSYVPPGGSGDGDFHEIKVDVSFAGADVRARRGYVAHKPEERLKRLLAAALALPGSVTDLPVEAQSFVSRPGDDAPNVLLAVAVEGSQVGLMIAADGERRVSLDVHTIALENGRPVDEAHEQVYARASAKVMPGDATGSFNSTLVGYMAYQHEWTLDPGSYTFNVAVVDNYTGRVGATSVTLEVAEPTAEWGLSDPLLVSVDDAGRVQPIVMGRIVPGQQVAAFVEVYGGRRPILSGLVILEDADENTAEGTKLFPLAMRRVAENIHRGSVPLPSGMPPGRYAVQLVITDQLAGEHQIVRLPLEVIALPSG